MRACVILGACLLAAASQAAPARGQQWGTIKGQVVWGDPVVPPRKPIAVPANQVAACMPGGKALLSEDYVIDPKTKGVRWVVVWLVDPNNPAAKLPIHLNLRNPADPNVVLDQPCCAFETHALGLRQGQTLVARNSASIPHNVKIDSSTT
jgi:hypothetical protein